MAMMWWILSHSSQSSGKWVGLFMVMASLPSLILIKPLGRWIDRLPSKKILVRSDCLAAFLLFLGAFLLLRNLFSLPLCFVFGFFAASLQAFIDPTLNKAVSEVVMPADLNDAVALLASTQSLANFSGAVFGAVLIDRVGIAGTVALASVGYLISSTASSLANYRAQTPHSLEVADAAGWAILQNFPFLKKILVCFGLINFFATPTLVVLPIYTKGVLQQSATVLGQLEAALWVGLLSGTFASRLVSDSFSRIKLGTLCLLGFGLCLLIPALVVSFPLYALALFVAGLVLGINNVKFMALFQKTVPQEMKGRFFALMQGLIGFTFPIAYFLFGALTDFVSVRAVCAIQGMGVILLAFYLFSLLKWENT